MPTPFYHLSIALELQNDSSVNNDIRTALNQYSSDFLFGNTAPDVQSITNQPRQTTHFFSIPALDQIPAWRHMLSDYPVLGQFSSISPNQAVFLIGYICHLEADEKWIQDIFLPHFGPEAKWNGFRERLYFHNVLRVYLDNQVLAELPEDIGDLVAKCKPNNWLPFSSQVDLQKWQSYLSDQLEPGAETKTAQVFAERHNLPASEFSEIMTSEEAMRENIFAHVPKDDIINYRQNLIKDNVELINQHIKSVEVNL